MKITDIRKELYNGKTIYDLKLRVVSYSRVSTDKEEQINSLNNQINYFKDYIKDNKNWIYINSYIDEGISGTSTNKRTNFLKMINDAKENKFDLIVTKEVSRFARNTIDSIKYTEELLENGVGVYFINDNLNTLYKDSEFRLTLMSSLAQDEVRKLSERVKFGIKRSIKDGKLGGSTLTGYIKKNGKLTIDNKTSPMIRLIYSLYVTNKYNFKTISKLLGEKGYYTKKGKLYSETTLKKIITNPRYKGYYTANLTEVVDYKTHKKIKHNKEDWIIYKDKNIPVIIDEKLWNEANKIYEKRKNKRNLNKEKYLNDKKYTTKIICNDCKNIFIRSSSGKRKINPVWICKNYSRYGLKKCQSPIIKEETLNKIIINKIDKLVDIKTIEKEMINEYIKIINNKNYQNKIKELNITKSRLEELIIKKLIDEKIYIEKINSIRKEINEIKKIDIKKELNKIQEFISDRLKINKNLSNYIDIFIDKIYINKINNNRKNINIKIIYNNKISSENIIIFL